MNYFEFTKTDYEYIIKEAMLDEEYQKLLEYKIKGYSIIKIADKLGISESTVSRNVKRLTAKIKKVL